MTTNKNIVPHALRSKIQPLFLTLFERPTPLVLFGFGLAILSLYGPIPVPDHNGFRYFLGPWICPWIGASYFLITPYNPYKGDSIIVGKYLDLERKDPDAARLVKLFQSKEARRTLLIITFQTSAILFLIMSTISILVRNSLNWTLSSHWLVPGIVGCGIGSFIAASSRYVAWGLKNWPDFHTASVADERT